LKNFLTGSIGKLKGTYKKFLKSFPKLQKFTPDTVVHLMIIFWLTYKRNTSILALLKESSLLM